MAGPPEVLRNIRLSMYGNDALWVTLPPNGEVVGAPRPHGVFEKFLTVRLIEGKLTAEATRLDGPAPPADVSIPGGYGTDGFQAFGVTFPTGGCWEITQRIADRELRFVVRVRHPVA